MLPLKVQREFNFPYQKSKIKLTKCPDVFNDFFGFGTAELSTQKPCKTARTGSVIKEGDSPGIKKLGDVQEIMRREKEAEDARQRLELAYVQPRLATASTKFDKFVVGPNKLFQRESSASFISKFGQGADISGQTNLLEGEDLNKSIELPKTQSVTMRSMRKDKGIHHKSTGDPNNSSIQTTTTFRNSPLGGGNSVSSRMGSEINLNYFDKTDGPTILMLRDEKIGITRQSQFQKSNYYKKDKERIDSSLQLFKIKHSSQIQKMRPQIPLLANIGKENIGLDNIHNSQMTNYLIHSSRAISTEKLHSRPNANKKFPLKTPRQMREDLKSEKSFLEERKEIIGEYRQFKKRERIIKNGWRHGILGIELPGDQNDSIYFEDPNREKKQKEKLRTSQKRMEQLVQVSGQSAQTDFCSSPLSQRKFQEKLVSLFPGWKTKRSNNYHMHNTYDTVFGDKPPKRLSSIRCLRMQVVQLT